MRSSQSKRSPCAEVDTADEVAWKTAIEAAPCLVGQTPSKEGVPPERFFDTAKPFKELVADDIRDRDER